MNIKVSNTCLNFSVEFIHLRFVYFSIAFAHINICESKYISNYTNFSSPNSI